jgi:hypothetical protein
LCAARFFNLNTSLLLAAFTSCTYMCMRLCAHTTNLNADIHTHMYVCNTNRCLPGRSSQPSGRILSLRGFHFAVQRFSVDEHRTHPHTPTGLISHHRPQNFISRGGIINSEPPPLFHTQRFRMENWCRRARPRVFSLSLSGADCAAQK